MTASERWKRFCYFAWNLIPTKPRWVALETNESRGDLRDNRQSSNKIIIAIAV